MNITAQQKSRNASNAATGTRRQNLRLHVYTITVSIIGLLLIAAALVAAREDPSSTLLFVALVVIAELTTSEVISPQMAFSMSTAVAFAAIPLFGPLPAALIASVGGLASTVVKTYSDRRQGRRAGAPFVQRALFNMAALGISMVLAGWIYRLLGGTHGNIALGANLLPLIAAAVINETTNALIVVVAVSLQTRQPALHIWRQNVSWALPINMIAMIIGGGGLALGFYTTGILGAAVYFLPVVTTIYAFRVYAERMKEQMERLEKTIIQREQAQTQLAESLEEKEILLKEIHHRVKNNLQVISSLLYVQARKVTDPEALEMFRESQNRVRAMALVHERLYESQDLSHIDFGKYVDSLSYYWLRSYSVNPNTVQLNISARDVYLGIDTAVPCALLINELASNALKHAFPDGRRGRIVIELHPTEDPEGYRLRIADDGVGFPTDIDIHHAETLGLQLVSTLVNQINGSITLDRSQGTAFTVLFGDTPL